MLDVRTFVPSGNVAFTFPFPGSRPIGWVVTPVGARAANTHDQNDDGTFVVTTRHDMLSTP